MKIRYCILVLFILLLLIDVKADDKCDKTELARLKSIAEKIDFDYSYDVKETKQGDKTYQYLDFSITALNLNPEVRVLIYEDYYMDKYKEFKNGKNAFASLSGFKAGERVKVTIEGYVNNMCSGKTLTTKTIKLPYYNNYVDDERCLNYPEFKYCSKLIEENISGTQFILEYNKYLASLEENNVTPIQENSTWNLLFIIGGIIIGLTIIVIVTMLVIKRRRKNSL